MKNTFLSALTKGLMVSAVSLAALSANAATPTLPDSVFEHPVLTQTVAAMNQSLLGMSCPNVVKSIQAYKDGGFTVEHSTLNAGCARTDQPNETRPYFKNVFYKMSVTDPVRSLGGGFSLRARYPLEFVISEQSALKFLDQVSETLAAEFLSKAGMVRMGGVMGSIRNGQGVLKQTYRTPKSPIVIFEIQVKLSPETEGFGSESSTVVEVSTRWDA